MTSAEASDDKEGKIDPKDVPWWTSCRLGLAILGFFGFINVYALRVNMSVAIVCMVNATAIRSKASNSSSQLSTHAECGLIPADANETIAQNFEDGEFVWDKTIQGLLLGSFFWGYLVTQIPGGWIATKFGGKKVYGISMLVACVATFITPLAANTSYVFLLVLRIILGICSGTCFPAMHALWGKWAPPLERSKLTAFTYAGAQVGNVVTFPLAALLCKYGFAGGWPSIFYVLGIMSFAWVVLWMFLASDSPEDHKRISKIEKDYIAQSLKESAHKETGKDLKVPWCNILKSLPVYAIVISNMGSDWGAYTLLTSMPTYLKEVLQLDITSSGLYSALPYIGFWMVINISGWMADYVQTRCCSVSVTRKFFDVSGKMIPAVMLIGLGYVDCSMKPLAIALLTLGVSLSGLQYSGFLVNHVDIAPPFAGILFGISNSMGSITGFVSPAIVGVITKEDQSRTQWQIVFYLAAGIYIFSALFFLIFGSGDLQEWARVEKSPEEIVLNSIEMKTVDNNEEEKKEDLQHLC